MAQTKEQLKSHMRVHVPAQELDWLGFKLNDKKCVWTLTQNLGFLINLVNMIISLPEDKLHKVKKECRHLFNKKCVTVRDLAHLISLLSSMIPAVNVAPLHYRGLQRLHHRILSGSAGNYDHQTVITEEQKKDLLMWVNNVQHFHAYSVVPPSADLVIRTDASKSR